MVESNRADSDGVDADLTLRAIAKYAYAQKSIIGTDYAMMVVMTEYVMAYSRLILLNFSMCLQLCRKPFIIANICYEVKLGVDIDEIWFKHIMFVALKFVHITWPHS